jgi:integrase
MTFTCETRTTKDGVNLGVDPVSGKRRQARLSAKTVKELRQKWIAETKRLNDGDYIEPSKVTLGDYLEHWLVPYARHNVRPYEQLIRVHIRPALANILLQKLTPAHLQRFCSYKLVGGRSDGKPGGLSPRPVRYLRPVIREALSQAVKWQLTTRNIADATEPPRGIRSQVQVWDSAEALRFLSVTADDSYGPVWLLALGTGLRRGELLALRWQDLDLTKGELFVRRNMVQLGSKLVFQEPKTSAGRRSVRLSPSLTLALKEHRTAQLEQRLLLGYWRDQDLVFTTADGGPIAPRNLIRRFKALVVRANVPKIRFHDLRHCHATILLQEGLPAKVVSERLGHASIAITLDTYSHVLPNIQEQAAEGIERALFGA